MLTPSSAAGDLRLDTEIIRLQHEFVARPSAVRFTLRAYLVDDKTRRAAGKISNAGVVSIDVSIYLFRRRA